MKRDNQLISEKTNSSARTKILKALKMIDSKIPRKNDQNNADFYLI